VDYAVSADSRRLLYVSSGAVYGKVPAGLDRIPEDYPGAPDTTSPSSCYGEAKRFSEMLCSTSGVDTVIARLFSFIGIYQDSQSSFAVPDFIRQAMESSVIRVHGDGTQVRGYCYASELSIMLWKLLLGRPSERVYNVGSDRFVIDIKSLAQLIADMLGSITVIVEGNEKESVNRVTADRYVPNMDRMRRIYEPSINIKESLERTTCSLQSRTGHIR
jgi:nucleoside-diphosphate-sugar epimerase